MNGIEIDHVIYRENDIRASIRQNDPIETSLHVLLVISNPCQYVRRYFLAREFIRRMEQEETDIILYIVELSHHHEFHVTRPDCPRHLQIATTTAPFWHKENLINMGVHHLLPRDWKAVAWIDGDVEFESPTWARDALCLLNGTFDTVQLFSHALDMDIHQDVMSIFSGFGFQHHRKKRDHDDKKKPAHNFWHPGFAWAMTRALYDKVGGLFEWNILGGGDHIMALSFLGRKPESFHSELSPPLKELIMEYVHKAERPRIGYVPGVIRHFFHGHKVNRRYHDRWKILLKHQYDPRAHITKRADGLLLPTPDCPPALLEDILAYFQQRNEDDCLS